jgi:Protein of unknown function
MALRDAGRADHVAGHLDNLALGPINPPDPLTRLNWFERELGWTDSEWVWASTETFWKEVLQEGVRKVAWLSRVSSPEYTGFLEWLWRLDGTPCEVVDLTDMTVLHRREDGTLTGPMRALSLALLHPETIVGNQLVDRAEPLPQAAREHYREVWQQLRAENAPLRVVTGDGLRSAPISFFDPLLLSCAAAEWQRAARVVGEAMGKDEFFQAGDMILATRVLDLVELGLLEGRGNLMNIRESEVRLARSSQGAGTSTP